LYSYLSTGQIDALARSVFHDEDDIVNYVDWVVALKSDKEALENLCKHMVVTATADAQDKEDGSADGQEAVRFQNPLSADADDMGMDPTSEHPSDGTNNPPLSRDDQTTGDADNSLLLSRDGQLTVDIEPP
jgi:hypothetical protein